MQSWLLVNRYFHLKIIFYQLLCVSSTPAVQLLTRLQEFAPPAMMGSTTTGTWHSLMSTMSTGHNTILHLIPSAQRATRTASNAHRSKTYLNLNKYFIRNTCN
jgi:hypothetical protein